MNELKLQTYTDGGARGNPGPAAYGLVIKNEQGETIFSDGIYIGINTNNQAEYQGLVAALTKAQELGAAHVSCYLDSELIVKQMKRQYKVKEPGMQVQFLKAWNLAASFKSVTFTHIRREFNKEADAKVNEALDQQLST